MFQFGRKKKVRRPSAQPDGDYTRGRGEEEAQRGEQEEEEEDEGADMSAYKLDSEVMCPSRDSWHPFGKRSDIRHRYS